jgi:hypothetical protein
MYSDTDSLCKCIIIILHSYSGQQHRRRNVCDRADHRVNVHAAPRMHQRGLRHQPPQGPPYSLLLSLLYSSSVCSYSFTIVAAIVICNILTTHLICVYANCYQGRLHLLTRGSRFERFQELKLQEMVNALIMF